MLELSKEQIYAHDAVVDWYKSNPRQPFKLSGLAGTGKTTVIGFIAATLKREFDGLPIAYVTYTGKASLVLAEKLDKMAKASPDDKFGSYLVFEDTVGTIHSLIYRPVTNERGEITGWARKDVVDASLIIVDEASMVDKDIWEDLLSYGVPILAVGDHGQLPPIGESRFSLMKSPDLKLTTVHRQALENPIIRLSLHVRRHGRIPTRVFGRTAAKFDYTHPAARGILEKYDFRTDSQILCGMNKTRVKLNDMVRSQNGFDSVDPLPGEKIICLKNNKEINVMNGQMGTLRSAKIKTDFLMEMGAQMDGHQSPIDGILTHRKCFGKIKYDVPMKECYNEKILKGLTYDKKPKVNLFDFGYAISVHKCVTNDTWLITDKGPKQLRQLDNGAAKGEFKKLQPTIMVHSGSALEYPTHFYNDGESNCRHIKTQCGYELTATMTHGCGILDDRNGFIEKTAAELKLGDYVLIRKNTRSFGDKDIENGRKFSRFLGYMVADGTVAKKRTIQYTKRHEECVVDFLGLIKTLFGYDGTYKLRKSGDYATFIGSKKIRDFCSKIDGIQPYKKFVPDFIMETTEANQCEFLKSVFEDGSVSINYKTGNFDNVNLSMKNEFFCDQVRMILLNMGIVTTKRKLKYGSSIIYIMGKNAILFKEKIGFISKFKRDRLNSLKSSNNERKSFPYFHRIMKDLVNDYGCPFDKKLQNSFNRKLTTIDVLNYFLNAYMEIMQYDDRYINIKFLLENYFFDKITKITPTKNHTYCLTMPSGWFIQNGMLHKNSQGSEFRRVVLIEERNFFQSDDDYTRWLYTGITRASEKLVIIDNFY